jgi:hypothetical protein
VTQPNPRRRVLTRRRVLVLLCAVAAAAAMVVAWRVDEKAQPCWTVRQFIDYNRDAQASLKAKTHFPAAGVQGDEPTVPTDADYQAWLEGLQQHANRVTAPGLSEHAHRAAQLARQFMTVMNQANDEIGKQDFLDPHLPPSAKTAATINREFDAEESYLAHACPR